MFSIDDVRIPIRIMLEPGIYTCGNISANGKTRLLNLCKEYKIAGYPVYGYTYNDFCFRKIHVISTSNGQVYKYIIHQSPNP